MSYFKKLSWELVPQNTPVVNRNCPKCSGKTQFVNSKKFRINANGNNIDIWLIYQCENCKCTWNMSIYERVSPNDISNERYQRFLNNDAELAVDYGFDVNTYNRNKAELTMDQVVYKVIQIELDEYCENKDIIQVKIKCKYPGTMRVDKLLSKQLEISRTKIKSLCQKGMILGRKGERLEKTKVRDGLEIFLPENLWNTHLD